MKKRGLSRKVFSFQFSEFSKPKTIITNKNTVTGAPMIVKKDSYFSGEAFRSSSAARTAAMTKAEKVQSFPRMASSTCSMTSFGNRTVLLVVGGTDGNLNDPTKTPRNTVVLQI